MKCEDFIPKYIHVYIHFDDDLFHYWMEQEENWDWIDKMTVEEFLKTEYDENIKTGKFVDYTVKPSKKITGIFKYILENMDEVNLFAEFGEYIISKKCIAKDTKLKDINFHYLKKRCSMEKFIHIYV